MSIIEVKDLSKTFITKDAKVEALKNINFSVEAGDILKIRSANSSPSLP